MISMGDRCQEARSGDRSNIRTRMKVREQSEPRKFVHHGKLIGRGSVKKSSSQSGTKAQHIGKVTLTERFLLF